ncbi:MAG: LPS assembly lipoprotein LptE [Rhizobiaceae bacterium]
MSWSDRRVRPRAALSGVIGLSLLGAASLTSGCTVGPLYGNAYSPTSTVAQVAKIAIEPVSTRQAQEVRNHLIYMFSGGKGRPADPAYRMDLVVSSFSSAAAIIQSGTTEQSPTSSLLNMSASYTVRDTTTGEVVATGRRQVASAYDVPLQEFAALRALRGAEDRAARELAEQVRLAVAQQVAQRG